MPMTASPRQNTLLTSLPADDYCRISSHLRTAPLTNRQMLQRRGEPLQDVYFPGRSLCALVMPMSDGSTPEIAAVLEGLEQSVACNGRHSVDARCCRWLLQAQDRLGGDELAVTHDVLASMLGVRRPTVTLIIADLSRHGMVSGSRGAIGITDRAALERRACECYRTEKRRVDYPRVVASATTFRVAESPDERASALAG
jgi:hypothetical protein